MTDFVLMPNRRNQIPTILTTLAPEFSRSTELLALATYDRGLAGVVCRAFARYLVRIHRNREPADAVNHEIVAAHRALDEVASFPETEVQELVAAEIFEPVVDEPSAELVKNIESSLGPHALSFFNHRRLYEWLMDAVNEPASRAEQHRAVPEGSF